MKKTLLAVAAAAALSMAVTTQAQASDWYVQGDLGFGKQSFKDDGDTFKSNDFSQRLAVGMDFDGQARVELGYTHHKDFKDSYQDPTDGKVDIKVKSQSLDLTGIYSLGMYGDFEPYAGLKLSYNKFKSTVADATETESMSDSKFGYGVLVGTEYKLTDQLRLTTAVQYETQGKFEGVKVSEFGVKAGLRYTF